MLWEEKASDNLDKSLVVCKREILWECHQLTRIIGYRGLFFLSFSAQVIQSKSMEHSQGDTEITLSHSNLSRNYVSVLNCIEPYRWLNIAIYIWYRQPIRFSSFWDRPLEKPWDGCASVEVSVDQQFVKRNWGHSDLFPSPLWRSRWSFSKLSWPVGRHWKQISSFL